MEADFMASAVGGSQFDGFRHVGVSEGTCLRSRFQYSRRSPYGISSSSDIGEWHKYQVVLEISGGALTALKWNASTSNSQNHEALVIWSFDTCLSLFNVDMYLEK
jgi:hypothetical protein